MRLHELSITAFGPFVETVLVDFDELAAAGVFLLTGDTGAGKTSVLDAVCFALYGEVPGDRHTARHLRSDQADPGAEPRVVLRLSIGERTLRFTRSPSWDRPKRRGSGTTRVQAHVVVEELTGHGWIGLTNRLDEAGHLVTALLGMTCTQFTQVAMLPQGRFQAFLRATSAERHAVLQRLFRTRRFEDVEQWLVERRLDLGRRCRSHQDVTAGVVNRFQEAAGVALPEGWEVGDLDAVAADGSLQGWAEHRLMDASSERNGHAERLTATTATLTRHQDELEVARMLAADRARGEAAGQRLTALEESRDLEESLAASLDAHRRAAPVLPQTLRVETAESHHAEAAVRAARHLDAVSSHLGRDVQEIDVAMLTAATTRLAEARAVAESWLPRERQLRDERARLTTLAAETTALSSTLRAGDERTAVVRIAHDVAVAALDAAVSLAVRAPADRLAVEAAQAGLSAAAEAADLEVQLADARSRLSLATSHAQDLRQVHLDLRERRISGMAAELAGGLAVGGSCPVCGSLEHPALASGGFAVGRDDEELARDNHESADFERQAVQELVTTLSTRLEAVLVRSEGHTVTHWRSSASTVLAAATESTTAEREATRLRDEVDALVHEAHAVATELASTRVALEERTRELAGTTTRHDQLLAELDGLLEGHVGVTTVSGLVTAHRRAVADLEEARAALTARDRTAHELEQATSAARSAATEAGFASLGDALAAVLPGSQAATGARQLDERRAARAAALSVLTEEQVVAALSSEAPDLPGLTAQLREITRTRDQQHAAHEQAVQRVRRLADLAAALDRALSDWAPVRRDHALVAGLASLTEGRSADNQLKMRLSAYVLSERLRQVVAAANERLGDMTDQRYVLEQADEKGAGEQRGGLSLRVRDEWNGKQRDPATLSGGETFLVSLALALGLADTVSHEAGGTQLDTLFIDEGFGALDATTLDAVMDTLDSLRDGGRVVGLVSHVAELRNRVPSQLEVRKARRGSTLCLSVASS
jgi:exonuclease SbcC